MANWAEKSAFFEKPRKADQDKVDAVIGALVGYQWIVKPRDDSVMIGDLETGYMIVPASPDVRVRLKLAADARGVAIDGGVSSRHHAIS